MTTPGSGGPVAGPATASRDGGRRREAIAVAEVCPFLVGGDGTWRSAFPSRAHHCSALQPPAPLAPEKQAQLCLAAAHRSCSTYRAAADFVPERPGSPIAGDAGLWPVSRPTVVTLDPGRGGRGIGSTWPRGTGQALLVGLMVVAFLVLLIARTSNPGGSGGVGQDPGASGDVALTGASASPGAASPGPSSTPGVDASPTPGASTSATPSPAGSAAAGSPAPPPTAARTYKVKSGDTLSSIAARFGVTVKALRRANGMTGNTLHVGRVLVIP